MEGSRLEPGSPRVLPSPNMPALDAATVCPGQCLLEGINLSEGRATTRPVEPCGTPWIDPLRIAATLNAVGLPGVTFRPVSLRPTGFPSGFASIHPANLLLHHFAGGGPRSCAIGSAATCLRAESPSSAELKP